MDLDIDTDGHTSLPVIFGDAGEHALRVSSGSFAGADSACRGAARGEACARRSAGNPRPDVFGEAQGRPLVGAWTAGRASQHRAGRSPSRRCAPVFAMAEYALASCVPAPPTRYSRGPATTYIFVSSFTQRQGHAHGFRAARQWHPYDRQLRGWLDRHPGLRVHHAEPGQALERLQIHVRAEPGSCSMTCSVGEIASPASRRRRARRREPIPRRRTAAFRQRRASVCSTTLRPIGTASVPRPAETRESEYTRSLCVRSVSGRGWPRTALTRSNASSPPRVLRVVTKPRSLGLRHERLKGGPVIPAERLLGGLARTRVHAASASSLRFITSESPLTPASRQRRPRSPPLIFPGGLRRTRVEHRRAPSSSPFAHHAVPTTPAECSLPASSSMRVSQLAGRRSTGAASLARRARGSSRRSSLTARSCRVGYLQLLLDALVHGGEQIARRHPPPTPCSAAPR